MKNIFSKTVVIALLMVMLTEFYSCKQSTSEIQKPGFTTIFGSIKGLQNQYLLIKNENPEVIIPDTIQLDGAGNFHYSTKIEKPSYFGIMVGQEMLQLYLRPNDSLKMETTMDQIADKLIFTGNSAIYNNFLLQSYRHDQQIQSTIYTFFNAPEKRVIWSLDSLRSIQVNRLDKLVTNFAKVDAYFIKNEKERILYTWALNRIIFPSYYRYVSAGNPGSLSVEYDTYLTELNLNDSSLLILPQYRRFLNNYFFEKLRKNNTASDKEIALISTSNRLEFVPEVFSSPQICDYLLYDLVRNHIKYFGNRDADSVFIKFSTLCTNQKYKNSIATLLSEWNHLKKGMPAAGFTYANYRGDSISLSNFKGKYVLIDIWATWCRPCLDQIPNLEKIIVEFSQKKIAFLSISVDQNKQDWLKMIKAKPSKAYQLYAGRSDVLKDFYMVSGIPRFILIDPKGCIVESNCLTPNEGLGEWLANFKDM